MMYSVSLECGILAIAVPDLLFMCSSGWQISCVPENRTACSFGGKTREGNSFRSHSYSVCMAFLSIPEGIYSNDTVSLDCSILLESIPGFQDNRKKKGGSISNQDSELLEGIQMSSNVSPE